jgi:hypothetical protein
MASELKACPFCGKKPKLEKERTGEFAISCPTPKCLMVTTGSEPTERIARNHWNKRAAEQMLVEALQAEIDRCRCGGTGLYSYSDEQPKIDCGECADMRAALRAAEGRAG